MGLSLAARSLNSLYLHAHGYRSLTSFDPSKLEPNPLEAFAGKKLILEVQKRDKDLRVLIEIYLNL